MYNGKPRIYQISTHNQHNHWHGMYAWHNVWYMKATGTTDWRGMVDILFQLMNHPEIFHRAWQYHAMTVMQKFQIDGSISMDIIEEPDFNRYS